MSSEIATRRLIEALADVNRTPGIDHGKTASPLLGIAMGMRFAAAAQNQLGEPEHRVMARINAAVADLAVAVDRETREKSNG